MANNYPTIRPTLSHNYAGMGVLPPDVTFTRASQSGGYYDGRTVVKAEENLFRSSQAFDDSTVWAVALSAVTANTTVAPDGTSTAETLTSNSAGQSSIRQAFTTLAAVPYVLSVFLKQGVDRYIEIWDGNSSNNYAVFDLQSGAVTQSGANYTASIVAAANGFFRCIVTFTGSAGSTQFRIQFTDNNATPGYNPSAVNTGLTTILWGAQLEQRSFATAYTPTTTAPITNYIPRMLFAAANVPVFDHNPTTGEALGLSVWEARTNLLTYSDDFSNVAWTKTNCTISSNQIISPDGTQTTDLFIPNNGATGVLERVVSSLAAGAYTVTFFAKAGGLSVVRWRYSNSQEWLIEFNLTTLAITNVTGTPTATAIQHVGNGVYRCVVTVTTNATRNFDFRIQSGVSAGNGTSGIYIWGAQLEAGAFATPYIPTVASTVARSADVAVMTGVNFSRWFNAGQGAIVADYFQNNSTASGGGLFGISDNTNNNRIILTADGASSGTIEPGLYVTVGGAGQVAIVAGTGAVNTFNKLSGVYAVNNFACSFNGAAVVTDVVGTLPTVDRAYIGLGATGASAINGYIRSLSYYPIALTSAQLQAVTA